LSTARRCINPPGPTYPGFSQAVRTGPWITVSGQLGARDGRIVSDDAEAQARQCFVNLETVLQAAGASLSDVVKLTCFMTDTAAYAGYAQVKKELFRENPPAGTGVIVAGLLDPAARMEVEAIAYCEA
jgi:enamine deaminase RidA (YjgF/YER057c/UK114 family)